MSFISGERIVQDIYAFLVKPKALFGACPMLGDEP